MKTVPFGKTGVRVSAFCLGAMYLGSLTDLPTSFQILDIYLDFGGSFIDTANIYAYWVPGCAGGESETLLGEWMRKRNNRSLLFLATKVGFEYPGIERRLRASMIISECERSLSRLAVDSIDLYYAHIDDRATPLEETLEAFYKLQQAGKVRFLGASNYLAWRLEEANWVSHLHGWPEFCCIQQRYTYLQPRPGASFAPQAIVNDDLLDYCQARGMPLLAYGTLLSGVYTRSDRSLPDHYRGPHTEKRLSILKSIAEEANATPNQVVLAWMANNKLTVIPLVAASRVEQLREDLAALNISLTVDQMARLNS